MQVQRHLKKLELSGEDGDTLTIRYDNRGEPYREGITVELRNSYTFEGLGVFLTNAEARQLRDLLNSMYPVRTIREI